jgi:hypothetical protein
MICENGWCPVASHRQYSAYNDKIHVVESESKFIINLILNTWRGQKNENNEMGGACRSGGGGERRVQGFGGET